MKTRFTDKKGYFIFTVIGILIVVTGIVMNILDRTASSDIGLKYGPTDNSSISGNLVIILGLIMLAAIFVFYLVESRKKV